MNLLISSLKLFRLKETISKIKGPIIALFVYGLYAQVPVAYYLHALLLSSLSMSYIYIINDFFDSNADKKSTKKKPIHYINRKQSILLISFLFLASITYFLMFFQLSNISIAAFALMMASGTFYSTSFLRLKEKGFLGIIGGAVCQRPLLFLAVFYGTPMVYSTPFSVYFFTVFFLLEAVVLIGHQVEDRANDIAAGLKTWAATSSEKTVKLLLNLTLATLGLSSLFLLYAISRNPSHLIASLVFTVLNVQAIHLQHLETYYKP